MRTLKNQSFLSFEVFRVLFCHLLVFLYELTDRIDDLVLNVVDYSLNEGSTHIFDSCLNPGVIMKEVSFARENP